MKSERNLLLALACIQFTHIVDFMIVMPLGDTLMNAFQITPAQFSYIVSSYTFSAGVAGVIAAFFIDRFDRKKALLWVYSGFTLGTIFCALSGSYELLLCARILTGFFGGIQSGLILSVVGDVIPYERRGKAMGFIMAAFSVASVVGVPVGYFFGIKLGWSAPFYLLSALGLLVVFMIYRYIPPLNSHIKGKFSYQSSARFLLSILSSRDLLTALAFAGFIVLGHFMIIPFIAPFMKRNIGFTDMQIMLIYFCGGAFTIFTSPLVGRLSDRIGKKMTFYIFASLSIINLIVLTNLQSPGIFTTLLITTVFFIVSSGRMIPANTMITSVVPPENRGSFMSLNISMQQFAAGLAAAIGGMVIKDSGDSGPLLNMEKAGLIAAITSLVAIFMARWIKEKN